MSTGMGSLICSAQRGLLLWYSTKEWYSSAPGSPAPAATWLYKTRREGKDRGGGEEGKKEQEVKTGTERPELEGWGKGADVKDNEQMSQDTNVSKQKKKTKNSQMLIEWERRSLHAGVYVC